MRSLALFVVLAVGSAHAGVTLSFERTRQGKTYPMTIQLDGVKLRTETATDQGQNIVVWDGEAKAMLSMRVSDKTYTRMDEQTLKAMKEQFAAMKAQMDAQMANMPPEQRAQMEKMMKGQGAPAAGAKPEVKVTALGKKQKVGSIECELYERVQGDMKQELCIAPWDKTPMTKDDMKPFQTFAEFMKSMLEGMPGMTTSSSGSNDELLGELERYKGFPIQTTSADPMGGTSVFTFKGATRGNIDKTAFAVPAGYTEKKLGSMGPPRRAP